MVILVAVIEMVMAMVDIGEILMRMHLMTMIVAVIVEVSHTTRKITIMKVETPLFRKIHEKNRRHRMIALPNS